MSTGDAEFKLVTSKRRAVRAGAGRPAEAVLRPEDAGFCIPTAPATGGRRRDRKADSRTGADGVTTLSAAARCVLQVQKSVEEVEAARFAASTRCAIAAFLAATLPPGTARARLTCFGLGSLRFGSNPRLQLALLVWLRNMMTACLRDLAAAATAAAGPSDATTPAAPAPVVVVDAYDPIFDAEDVAVFAALGIDVLDEAGAEAARRVQPASTAACGPAAAVAADAASGVADSGVGTSPRVTAAGTTAPAAYGVPPVVDAYVPTVFFMPHCNADLYDALLRDNGWPDVAAAAVVADSSGAGATAASAAAGCDGSAAPPLTSACVIGNSFGWYARSRGVVVAASGAGAAVGGSAAASTGAPAIAGVAAGRKAKAAPKHALGGAGAAARPSADDLTAPSLAGADVLAATTAGPPVPHLLAACAATRVVPAADLAAALSSHTPSASAPPASSMSVLECAMPLDGCDELLYRAMDATSLHFFFERAPAAAATCPTRSA